MLGSGFDVSKSLGNGSLRATIWKKSQEGANVSKTNKVTTVSSLTAMRSVVHQRPRREIDSRPLAHAVVEATLDEVLAVVDDLQVRLVHPGLADRDASKRPAKTSRQVLKRKAYISSFFSYLSIHNN